MAITLEINAGGSSLDLNGSDFNLASGWAPKIARYSQGLIGGKPHFLDVTEEIPIRVFGTSKADVKLNARALFNKLYAASIFATRRSETPALLIYNNLGTGNDWKALITGIGAGEDLTKLTIDYLAELDAYETYVTIFVTRRGVWTRDGSEGTGTITSTATPWLEPFSVSGGAGGVAQAVRVDFTGFGGFPDDTLEVYPSGYVLLSPLDNSTGLFPTWDYGPTLTAPGAGSFASAADTDAEGGSVYRATPGALGTYVATIDTSTVGPNLNTGLWGIIANVKNRSAAVGYNIRGSIRSYYLAGASPLITKYTPYHFIPAGDNDPQLVFLGYLPYPQGVTAANATIEIEPTATGAAGDSLDLDYGLVFIANHNTNLISFNNMNAIETPLTSPTNSQFTIDPRPLANCPRVWHGHGPNVVEDFVTYEGDAYFQMDTPQVGSLFIGGNTGPRWGIRHGTSNNTVTSLGATLTAYSTWLLPE